ncbi:MAG: DUF563 domain-containing protein [Sphingomonas sp.]|nr:DUF563 domain-containing protein [Sphingomonas sp.]
MRHCHGAGDLDAALTKIIDLVLHVGVRDGAIARVFSSPVLDQLCHELGSASAVRGKVAPDPDHSVIIATSVARTGGHSRVIRDLLRCDPGKRKTLLLTGVKVGQPRTEALSLFEDLDVDVEIAPFEANNAGRLVWLASRLRELSPSSAYLVIHPFDAVAVAAAQPGVADNLFYYHNSDHSLALGVHLDHAVHVDYHRKGYDRCNEAGVLKQAFWPLAVSVPTKLVRRDFTSSKPLVTCCCGGFEKFETPHMAESFPYSIRYEDMVLRVLETTGGRHLHVGQLSDDMRERIARRLHEGGVPVSNFLYLPFAAGLAPALREFSVDAYLGSMPRGGGRATAEAMGAGLPLVLHSNYRSRFFSDESEAYPEAFVWRPLDELKWALESLDLATLRRHGTLAREHYEGFHRPSLLRTAIRKTIQGKLPGPPPRTHRYPADELQTFFDERHGYETFSATFDERQGPWVQTFDPMASALRNPAPDVVHAPIEPIDRGTAGDEGLGADAEEAAARAAIRRRRTHLVQLAKARAKRRSTSNRVRAADQAFTPERFVGLVAQRFDSGLGTNIFPGAQFYVMFVERPADVTHHSSSRLRAQAREQLFLADVLKAQGFFGDAEDIYRDLIAAEESKAPALRGLGDLLLLMAAWAQEFQSYGWDGRALNPYEKLGDFKGLKTWHSSTFEDALRCLKDAVAEDPDDPDGLWLLTSGLMMAGQWRQAAKSFQRYEELAPDVPDLNAMKARVTFGVNQEAAVSIGRKMFAGWRDPFGRRWNTASAEIASAHTLPRETASYTKVDDEVVQPINSYFVKNGEVLTFDHPLTFEASYVAEYQTATVLPLFGMLLANDRQLVPESLHHRECHFDVFTAAVRAVHDERALLIMPEADETVPGPAIFIGCNNNYYHWLIDEIPRLRVLRLSDKDDGRPVLIDKAAQPWQLELLKRFGISEKRLVKVDFLRPQKVRNLLAPSHLSTLMVAHPLAVQFIRENLLKGAHDANPARGKRLYVARSAGTVAGRSIINGDEIWARFKKAGFKRVDPGTLTIDEQIALFRDAEIIAGPGGAGLTNAVFAPPGAKILNLTSSDIACQTFTSIAAAVGQESWFCGGASMARSYPRWIWTNFDYFVDVRDVDICLESITA